jgi:hypothetical protein
MIAAVCARVLLALVWLLALATSASAECAGVVGTLRDLRLGIVGRFRDRRKVQGRGCASRKSESCKRSSVIRRRGMVSPRHRGPAWAEGEVRGGSRRLDVLDLHDPSASPQRASCGQSVAIRYWRGKRGNLRTSGTSSRPLPTGRARKGHLPSLVAPRHHGAREGYGADRDAEPDPPHGVLPPREAPSRGGAPRISNPPNPGLAVRPGNPRARSWSTYPTSGSIRTSRM